MLQGSEATSAVTVFPAASVYFRLHIEEQRHILSSENFIIYIGSHLRRRYGRAVSAVAFVSSSLHDASRTAEQSSIHPIFLCNISQ